MRIELHPDADAEFAAGIDYYNTRLPGLGNRFYREVMSRLEWILENPFVARERSGYRRVNSDFFRTTLPIVSRATKSQLLRSRMETASPNIGRVD